MSKISLASNASGTGIFTLASPATNTNRTLTLPDSTGTLLDTNGGTITGTLTVTGVTTLGNGAILGSPASVGTMPAFTLGGTVSGGGNNINNVVIGATTPLAGAFTTLSSASNSSTATGLSLTNVQTNNGYNQILLQGSGGSNIYGVALRQSTTNNLVHGGDFDLLCADSSNVLTSRIRVVGQTGGSITFTPDGANTVATLSTTGLAVTGTLSATGNATFSGGTATIDNLVNTVGQAATLNLTTFNTNFGSSYTLQLLTTLNNATTGASTSTFKQFNHNIGSNDVFITKTSGDAGYLAISTGTGAAEVARFTTTGLAVTGTLSATATGAYFTNNGVTTSAKYIQILNTNGGAYIGVESSAGGAMITGSTGYDAAIVGQSGIAFSGSNGNAMQMRLTSSALALQSGISLTGGTSGTGFSFSGSAPAGSLTLASDGRLTVGTNLLGGEGLALNGNGDSGDGVSMVFKTLGVAKYRIGRTAGIISNSSNELCIQAVTGLGMNFYVNGSTQAAVLDSSGNLLVGATSSLNTADFQLSKGSGASSAPYAAIFNTATTPTSSASTRFDLGFLSGASNYVATGTILGQVNFMGQANDEAYGGAYMVAEVTSGGNVARASGHSVDLRFGTKSSSFTGTAEVARFTGSGNLGIGTTLPAYRLEVATGTEASGQVAVAGFRTASTTASYNSGIHIYATASATAASRQVVAVWDADGANSSGGDYFLILKNGNSGATDILNYSNAAIRFGANYTNRVSYDMTLDTSGNLLVGTTTALGTITNTTALRAGIFSTNTGSTSAANNTATTLATLSSGLGTYIISLGFNGVGAASTYSAVSIVNVDTTTTKKTDLVTSSGMVISLSGLDIQGLQTAGSTLNISWSILRIQ